MEFTRKHSSCVVLWLTHIRAARARYTVCASAIVFVQMSVEHDLGLGSAGAKFQRDATSCNFVGPVIVSGLLVNISVVHWLAFPSNFEFIFKCGVAKCWNNILSTVAHLWRNMDMDGGKYLLFVVSMKQHLRHKSVGQNHCIDLIWEYLLYRIWFTCCYSTK